MVEGIIVFVAVILVFGLPTFGVFAGYRMLSGYFFKRQCRKLVENTELEYQEPTWSQLVFTEKRGILHGRYQDMPLHMELEGQAYMLRAHGKGQLLNDISLQKQGLFESLLPTIIRSITTLKSMDADAFQQHFKTEGESTALMAILNQQARDHIISLGRLDVLDGFSMWLRDDHLEVRARKRENGRYKPADVVFHTHQLYQSLLLPRDHSERRQALAQRLTQEFQESQSLAHRLQLGTAHLETFPELIEQTGMADALSSAQEPYLQWLMVKYNALTTHNFQEAVDFACMEYGPIEMRVEALDLLQYNAPPQISHHAFTRCLDASTMAIRREAKKRLKYLKQDIATDSRAGSLSVLDVDDEEGKLSVAAEAGGISLAEDGPK